jgi:hypothetical protein
MKIRVFCAFGCILIFSLIGALLGSGQDHERTKTELIREDGILGSADLPENPLSFVFIQNEGQGADDIGFYAFTEFGRAVFFDEKVVFEIGVNENIDQLVYEFQDTEGPKITGLERAVNSINIYHGRDGSKWSEDIDCFDSIIYSSIWKNIDLKYYFSGEQLKYDIILHPGSDPSDIRIRTSNGIGSTTGGSEISIPIGSDVIFKDLDLRTHYLDEPENVITSSFRNMDGSTFGFDRGHQKRQGCGYS